MGEACWLTPREFGLLGLHSTKTILFRKSGCRLCRSSCDGTVTWKYFLHRNLLNYWALRLPSVRIGS